MDERIICLASRFDISNRKVVSRRKVLLFQKRINKKLTFVQYTVLPMLPELRAYHFFFKINIYEFYS